MLPPDGALLARGCSSWKGAWRLLCLSRCSCQGLPEIVEGQSVLSRLPAVCRRLATAAWLPHVALPLLLSRHPALPSLQVLLQLLSPLPGGRHRCREGGQGPLRCGRACIGLRSMTHRSASGLRVPVGRDVRGKQFMMRVPAGRALAAERACRLTRQRAFRRSQQARCLCRFNYPMPKQLTSLPAQAWTCFSTSCQEEVPHQATLQQCRLQAQSVALEMVLAVALGSGSSAEQRAQRICRHWLLAAQPGGDAGLPNGSTAESTAQHPCLPLGLPLLTMLPPATCRGNQMSACILWAGPSE